MEKRRYLINFSTDTLSDVESTFVVIGSGIAGLKAAITLASYGKVLVLTKDKIKECNSYLAQGGIAAAIGENDNIKYHIEDTLKVGCGLCYKEAVELLISEGPKQINELLELGANFDKTSDNHLALTREGAHTKNRIIHARGDAIGIELELTLLKKAQSLNNITFVEQTYVLDILTVEDKVYGILALNLLTQKIYVIYCQAIILATGGIGYLFKNTTNSHIATGDGIAIASRAKAEITDMEFIQFHPTTLSIKNAPQFLISEAVRGEGAYLLNVNGERFMKNVHELEELAPRDVISREILKQMKMTNHDCVYLDITHLNSNFIIKRFPQIYENCLKYGIDITKDKIPVSPSAHYMIGGVKSGLNGETNILGLYTCGEVACTYVHGANRLASNSLLECVVFGNLSALSAINYVKNNKFQKMKISYNYSFNNKNLYNLKDNFNLLVNEIKEMSWNNLGIFRNYDGFIKVDEFIKKYEFIDYIELNSIEGFILNNMFNVLKLINKFAKLRCESRGTHYREDYPQTNDEMFKFHFIDKNGEILKFYV